MASMNEIERDILEDIEAYGCSVVSVFDPEGRDPTFAYSVGIARSAGAPEIIIIGLEPEASHWIINEYNRRVREGEYFSPGVWYSGFLKGFVVQFMPVGKRQRAKYMLSACWLYGGPKFDALQLIWPSGSGFWPWEREASDQFRASQPLLSHSYRCWRLRTM
jgi:hypothetical protein